MSKVGRFQSEVEKTLYTVLSYDGLVAIYGDIEEKYKTKATMHGIELFMIDKGVAIDDKEPHAITNQLAFIGSASIRNRERVICFPYYDPRIEATMYIAGCNNYLSSDMDKIVDYIGKPFDEERFHSDNLIDNDDAFGRRIRYAIFNFLRRNGFKYVGFGDEHEVVDQIGLFGCEGISYGVYGTAKSVKESENNKWNLLGKSLKRMKVRISKGIDENEIIYPFGLKIKCHTTVIGDIGLYDYDFLHYLSPKLRGRLDSYMIKIGIGVEYRERFFEVCNDTQLDTLNERIDKIEKIVTSKVSREDNLVVVLPMGHGKTYLSSKYKDFGFVDIDDYRDNDVMQPIFELAMKLQSREGWDDHNNVWFGMTDDLKYSRGKVIFLHSLDHAHYLGVKDENIFIGVIKLDVVLSYNQSNGKNLEALKTNYDSLLNTRGVIEFKDYSSLEQAIINWVDQRKISRYSQLVKYYLGMTNFNGKKVLDYGCGKGELVRMLNSLNIDAIGYDPYSNDKIYCVKPSGKYDIIILSMVFHHLDKSSFERVMYDLLMLSTNGATLVVRDHDVITYDMFIYVITQHIIFGHLLHDNSEHSGIKLNLMSYLDIYGCLKENGFRKKSSFQPKDDESFESANAFMLACSIPSVKYKELPESEYVDINLKVDGLHFGRLSQKDISIRVTRSRLFLIDSYKHLIQMYSLFTDVDSVLICNADVGCFCFSLESLFPHLEIMALESNLSIYNMLEYNKALCNSEIYIMKISFTLYINMAMRNRKRFDVVWLSGVWDKKSVSKKSQPLFINNYPIYYSILICLYLCDKFVAVKVPINFDNDLGELCYRTQDIKVNEVIEYKVYTFYKSENLYISINRLLSSAISRRRIRYSDEEGLYNKKIVLPKSSMSKLLNPFSVFYRGERARVGNTIQSIMSYSKSDLKSCIINRVIDKPLINSIDDKSVGCALWSLSNVVNPPPLYMLQGIKSKFIIMYPLYREALRQGIPILKDKNGFSYMEQNNNGQIFKDWLFEPYILLHSSLTNLYVVSIRQGLAIMERERNGEKIDDGEPISVGYDPSRSRNNLWCFVTNINNFHSPWQEINTNQAIGIKRVAQLLRSETQGDAFSGYLFRKYVLYCMVKNDMFENLEKCIMFKTGFDAIMYFKFPDGSRKSTILTISGHFANMLLAAHYRIIDWKHYVGTIRANLRLLYDNSKVETYQRLVTAGVIVEVPDNKVRLWHNYYDYYISLYVYSFICTFYKIGMPYYCKVSVAYLSRELKKLSHEFPNFKYSTASITREILKKKMVSVPYGVVYPLKDSGVRTSQ